MHSPTPFLRPPLIGRTTILFALLFFAFALPALAQISTFPYFENFESNNGSFAASGSPATRWRWGAPCGTISGAASGSNCWISQETSCTYTVNNNAYLTSPVFDMSGLTDDPFLRFKLAYVLEEDWDFTYLHYSTDNGATWIKLDDYNGEQTGKSKWQTRGYKLCGAAGNSQVLIRWNFQSDVSVQYAGIAIDDVEIGNLTIPTCQIPYSEYPSDAYVSKVIFNTINNTSSYASTGYIDYSSTISTDVIVGFSYNLTVGYDGYADGYAAAWFDWDHSGTFDANERYLLGTTVSGNNYTVSVSVPSGATPGITKFRVRARYDRPLDYPGPCDTTNSAEAEDYAMNIITGDDQIRLDPTALTFTAEQLGALPASQPVNVTTLPGAFQWNTAITQSPNWMSVNPPTAMGISTCNVSINTTNIPTGTYNGTVRFSGATAIPQDLPVTYNVIPRVRINPLATPVSVRIGCGNPALAPKFLPINNNGGSHNGGQLVWSATSTDPSIAMVAGSGIEGDNLRFTVNPAGLTQGTHYKTITITGYNSATGVPAENSPYTLQVAVEVMPLGQFTQTQSLTSGSFREFVNAYGQVIAEVKSNSGNIASFTVKMVPCSVPNGFPRARYSRVWYTFTSSTPSVNLDIRLTHSHGDDYPLVTRPDLLTVWRQPGYPASNGSWVNLGGTADGVRNNVLLTGLTAVTGRFALAHVWNPKAMNLDVLTSRYDRTENNVYLEWNSKLSADEDGFIVEKTPADMIHSDEWTIVGAVNNTNHGQYSLCDRNPNEGAYYYRLSVIDTEGNQYESTPILVNVSYTPTEFVLEQNFPNPFNPLTTIRFTVPETGPVALKVFDMHWREVSTLVQEERSMGSYTVQFDASKLPSGTYFYRLEAAGQTAVKRMNLLK